MSVVRTVGLVGQLVNIYLQLVASCLDYFSWIFLNTTKKRYDVPSHLGLNIKNLISALLPSCTFIITSFPAAWILRSQSFQTHRKCQLFYLSAVSLRVHTSSEPLSASIRFSQSAVRLLLSLLSETDVGAHRIMVNKTTSRMLHLRDFLLYFFCSYSTFNAAVCWKKKTYTKERGTEKKVSVYLHHIPFPKRRRRRRRRKAMSPLSVWHLSLEDMRTRALWKGLRREDRAFTSTWCKVQRVIIIVLTQSCTFS